MAVERGIFVVDGSHLFASIRKVHDDHKELSGLKLKVDVLTQVIHQFWTRGYTGPSIRTTYYFKKGDKRIGSLLEVPVASTPGNQSHWQINECAEAVSRIPESEINKLDPKYRDQVHRAEKGLDMELACDVMQLVAGGRVDSVVFMVNDRDYIPLFRTLQRMGANTYLFGLDSKQPIQRELVKLADHYHTFDNGLKRIFGYKPPVAQG